MSKHDSCLNGDRKRPPRGPLFGLWIPDGGPDHQGHWLVDTSAIDCDGHPAVFFDRELAERCAEHEREDFPDIAVVELQPVGGGR